MCDFSLAYRLAVASCRRRKHSSYVRILALCTWLLLEGHPALLELFARLVYVGGEESQVPETSVRFIVAARINQIGIVFRPKLVFELHTCVLHVEQPLMGLMVANSRRDKKVCWVQEASISNEP